MDTTDWFSGFKLLQMNTQGASATLRVGGEPGAPALVLLHGFPQTHVMWHRVARELAPHFRLVLPDLRGYGDSSHAPGQPDGSSRNRPPSMPAQMHRPMHCEYSMLMARLSPRRCSATNSRPNYAASRRAWTNC